MLGDTGPCLSKNPTRKRSGVGAAVDDRHTVDDHVGNTGRIRSRFGKRRPFGDRRRIEYGDVGHGAGPENAAIGEPECRASGTCHLVHGLRQRQQPEIPCVVAEDAGKAP